MRMTKKVTAMALASMMALSLAGCGGSSSTTATTAAATEAAKETTAAATEAAKEAATTAAAAAATTDVADKKVGISIYKFDDNFMTLYRTELVRYLTEDLGFKAENVVVQDGKGDQAEQTNQIQNFITQKYDVLILNLVQASSAPDITDMCKEAGIPVVYINREPDATEEERWESEGLNATYVGCDARQSGTYQGVIILIVIPLLLAAIILILKTAFPRFGEMQRRLDRLNSGIQESLTNVRVVKSFVREDHEIEKFSRLNRDLKESSLRALRIVITTMPVMMFAMNVTTLAVVWYGGNIIIAGKMPVGDLTAFTTYIVQILMSLMMLSMVFLQSSRASASMKRINEIFDTEINLNDDNAENKDKKVTEGRVEFKNVSFGYSGENGRKDLVLEGISFTAEPGQTIGIIGSTGSGKTSLVQLIPRLYDVTGGEVLVDGVNVKDYSLKHLREGVGMVLQKNVLFSGTIEENLRWGNEDAPMEDVIRFSESAQADPFVKTFKNGYDTEMGQGGVNVSGGQKQRLCIARALLKRPKILILDDSTSAVDTATEAKIRESLYHDLKDTTKIIIAQRISSVQEADQILVLEDGKIIGHGTHEELLKTCETYSEIYTTQIGNQSIGAGEEAAV